METVTGNHKITKPMAGITKYNSFRNGQVLKKRYELLWKEKEEAAHFWAKLHGQRPPLDVLQKNFISMINNDLTA